jgi:hypothetical protein
MMKSAVNALYKLHWNLDHYCPHEMFSDRERFVIEVSTGPTTSAQKQRSESKGNAVRVRKICDTVGRLPSNPDILVPVASLRTPAHRWSAVTK